MNLRLRCRRQILVGAISLLLSIPQLALAAGPCRKPGEVLIGEDKYYYYCSRKSCAELGKQLESDKRALARQRRSSEAANKELQEWTKANASAQKNAFEHATEFLAETILAAIKVNRQAALKKIVDDFKRAEPKGMTWKMKLLKVAKFDRSYDRLVVQITALEAIEFPGVDIYKTWADFKKRARAVGQEAHVLAATWDQLATDPDARRAFREHGFEFSANALKQALEKAPGLQQSLSFGKFLVDYGYDARKWQLSRRRILKNIARDEKNLFAACVLSRQLQITVRDYNICKGKMPKPGSARPEDIKCVRHAKR